MLSLPPPPPPPPLGFICIQPPFLLYLIWLKVITFVSFLCSSQGKSSHVDGAIESAYAPLPPWKLRWQSDSEPSVCKLHNRLLDHPQRKPGSIYSRVPFDIVGGTSGDCTTGHATGMRWCSYYFHLKKKKNKTKPKKKKKKKKSQVMENDYQNFRIYTLKLNSKILFKKVYHSYLLLHFRWGLFRPLDYLMSSDFASPRGYYDTSYCINHVSIYNLFSSSSCFRSLC